jgi:hypothetical protein
MVCNQAFPSLSEANSSFAGALSLMLRCIIALTERESGSSICDPAWLFRLTIKPNNTVRNAWQKGMSGLM